MKRRLQTERAHTLGRLLRSLPMPRERMYCEEIAKCARRARGYRKTLANCVRGHCACTNMDDAIEARILTLVHAINEKDAKTLLMNHYTYLDVVFSNHVNLYITT